MKNILLLVHDDAGQEARLQVALDVVRAVAGHLICLDVSVMPVLMEDYYSGAGAAMILADEQQREAGNRARLEARLPREGVSWEWIDTTGQLPQCVNQASLMADLIVLNRKLESTCFPDMSAAAGEAIVKSGKPLLAVPENAKGLQLAGRVLVAWDGSPCAQAALQRAVPLLRLAEGVTLSEIDDGSLREPAEEAATYLSRHGVHPVVHSVRAHGRKAAALLLDEIENSRCDYLVMGGFGHRRFVEAMLGGVTRTMLAKSPVPIFFAH